MAVIGRHPAAAGLVFLAVGCVVVLGAFLLVLRAASSDPSPGLLAAQGMAHRLLRGGESIDTDVHRSGQYVFRVVYQTSDGNVGASLAATHLAWPSACAATPRRRPRASPTGTSDRRAATGSCA
jgi:hypothetical protein